MGYNTGMGAELLTGKQILFNKKLRLIRHFRNDLESDERSYCEKCHLVVGADSYGASDEHVARVCRGYGLVVSHKPMRRPIPRSEVKEVKNGCMLNSISNWRSI